MFKADDATLSNRQAASPDALRVALRFFSAYESLRPKPLFEDLSRQSEVYDPETMPNARLIVDQVHEAMKRHERHTMPSSGNEGQAVP
jgi:hypothetical protein